MAQFNYEKLAQRADKIMKRFGQTPGEEPVVAYLRRSGTDRPVTALEHDFAPHQRDGTLVQENDIRYLVSVFKPDGSGVLDPAPNDRLDEFVLDNAGVETVYQMVRPPKRTQPGNFNVFWQLHLRPR